MSSAASPFAGRLAAKACDGRRQLPGQRCHLWHAALADNLRRLGRTAEAAGGLEIVAAFAPTQGERLLLSRLLDVRPEPA
jgi:predicted RNA polymerase sigma factor